MNEPSSLASTPSRPPAFSPVDSWAHLRRFTSARIALGRTGGSVRTETLLDFRLAHARARDAVAMTFDVDALIADLTRAGIEACSLATRAIDRASFHLRPDLGRELSPESRTALDQQHPTWGQRDLAIIVSDGLSALAATRQIEPTLTALLPLLRATGFSIYPILVAPFARVKLQDEIGEQLHARHTLMLLGERPGLGAPDSLGAYFTFAPGAARTDADRNCVSNIRPEGLPPHAAAHKLAHLLRESARRGLSGVALKDAGPEPPSLETR